MDPDRLLLMGRVGRPHGVRGELKAIPETDTPERFAGLDRLFVGPAERVREVALDGVRFQYPKGRTVPLLALAGVESLEAAEDLRGAMLWADVDDLPPLDEGEAYLHDLVGLDVFLVDDEGAEAGEPFGTVADVYEAAQLLFAIDRPGASQVLLPDVPEFVLRLDLAARRLYVRPPEGLIEE